MGALDVITFGEAMSMFVADDSGDLAAVSRFTRRQSGAEANVAIGLSRLGLRVGWVSRVGDDSLGRFILKTMISEGVDCSHVGVDKHHPRSDDRRHQRARRESGLGAPRNCRGTNPHPFTAPDEIARFYVDQGAQLVALKLGSEGAYFRTPREEGTVAALRVEQVIDTVGAGDGFAVGVVSALLEGLDPSRAVARGNRIGDMAIQVVGDMEGLPTRRELDVAEGR